jgi:hypothetical protein
MLELRPVHDALREQFEPNLVRDFADLAEHPRGAGPAGDAVTHQQRAAFLEQAWMRTWKLMDAAQRAWVVGVGGDRKPAAELRPATAKLADAAKERLRAAMRIPALEGMSPAPWSGAARHVLPSPSPRRTATAMWGPVLAWCVVELLAESIDPDKPQQVALELFDRLRLREPFGHAFASLGFEGEESWRVAARIKVVLLTEAELEKERSAAKNGASSVNLIGLPPDLWQDPDVRWLTGAHEAQGHTYIVREFYEELLWWMRMPSLLKLAGEASPRKAEVDAISKCVADALAEMEAAGYRVDVLLKPEKTHLIAAAPIGEEGAAIEARALEEKNSEDEMKVQQSEAEAESATPAESVKHP